MSLSRAEVLLIDGQTTGMRPPRARLLEFAWALTSAAREPAIRAALVRLPEGESIPPRITEITGVTDEDLADGLDEAALITALEDALAVASGEAPVVVAHYALFEKAFLDDLWTRHRGSAFPWKLVCTHKLAERLFPRLPSRNIRAVAGAFGHSAGELKRAGPHVGATVAIWKGLCDELDRRGIRDWPALEKWLAETPKPKREGYDYNVDRLKRLKLPNVPGVYRMLSKDGKILYVGKATSLRDRVNSYFRGVKGRDPRKLELMARAWDLQVTECGSPLESALLESDEIKRWNPPYNVSLKTGRRKLVFYDRSYARAADAQDENHPHGPFRPMNSIDQLAMLQRSWSAGGEFEQIFYHEIDPATMREGFGIFLAERGIDPAALTDLRSYLAIAMRMLREELARRKREAESADDPADETADETDNEADADETAEDREPTAPEVAEKFGRLFLRAAAEIRKARALTKLLDARVSWTWKKKRREIESRGGRVAVLDAGRAIASSGEAARRPSDARFPWRELDIADYDRMSILLSAITLDPENHRVEARPRS